MLGIEAESIAPIMCARKKVHLMFISVIFRYLLATTKKTRRMMELLLEEEFDLNEQDRAKDKDPMECMLAMLKMFDGIRIYRLN